MLFSKFLDTLRKMEESKRFIQIAVALIYKSTIIIDVIDEKSKAQII